PRCGRLSGEHVDPLHARAARRDERLVVEVVVARGHPQPSRDDRGRLELVRFVEVRLGAPAHLLAELRDFYARFETGETKLEFKAVEGAPFYHFAFLTPPEGFDAVLEATPSPLPDRETGEVVFDFDFWDAKAFYFHDPAGNIVEVIAHEGIDDHGLSELG